MTTTYCAPAASTTAANNQQIADSLYCWQGTHSGNLGCCQIPHHDKKRPSFTSLLPTNSRLLIPNKYLARNAPRASWPLPNLPLQQKASLLHVIAPANNGSLMTPYIAGMESTTGFLTVPFDSLYYRECPSCTSPLPTIGRSPACWPCPPMPFWMMACWISSISRALLCSR